MSFQLPSEPMVTKEVQEWTKVGYQFVYEQHSDALYRLESWFKKRFFTTRHLTVKKVLKVGVKGVYSGTKLVVDKGVAYTVGQIPIVGIGWDIFGEAYSLAEQGIGNIHASEFLKKQKAARWHGAEHHSANQLVRYVQEISGKGKKFKPEGAGKRIERCAQKLKEAHEKLSQFKQKKAGTPVNCKDLTNFIHDSAYYDYRLKRLQAELFVMKEYVQAWEKTALEFGDDAEDHRKALETYTIKRVMTHKRICKDFCMLKDVA